MVKIHGPDGVLASPLAPDLDGTQWAPFTDATQLEVLRGALWILHNNVTRIPTCDNYFVGLPGGRSFKDVLEDLGVWISYDPTGPNYGVTHGNNVTISGSALTEGRWRVAAVLVRELAHFNKATDARNQAEKALFHCGLKEAYNPGADSDLLPPSEEPTTYRDPPPARLEGTWRVRIGNWDGFFVFGRGGICSWRNGGGERIHMGKWKVTDREVQWSYDDDPKGWQRVFHTRLPIGYEVDGNITINGAPHGFFQMSTTTMSSPP